ncbi:MAG: hypothetical protein JWQ97_3077 [Phenylobacterium sp.]|nr:hypothetical protein [Phenylobacterium sp.]
MELRLVAGVAGALLAAPTVSLGCTLAHNYEAAARSADIVATVEPLAGAYVDWPGQPHSRLGAVSARILRVEKGTWRGGDVMVYRVVDPYRAVGCALSTDTPAGSRYRVYLQSTLDGGPPIAIEAQPLAKGR